MPEVKNETEKAPRSERETLLNKTAFMHGRHASNPMESTGNPKS